MIDKKILLVFIVLIQNAIYCQGTLKIYTDKANYSYGDSITVSVTVTNNTDTSFTLIGSSTCFMRIKFNDVRMSTMCTTDQHEFYFSPGTSMTWIWYLDPKELGIPDIEGIQRIVGICGKLKDSVFITAPKYLGGTVAVGLKDSISESEYQSLRDSINATVIHRSLGALEYEYWRIVNHSIDSLVAKYSGDYRLSWIEAKRSLQVSEQIITDVKEEYPLQLDNSILQNYPNPFNPTTTIEYAVANQCKVRLEVYDILGNKIAVLVDEEKLPGNYNAKFDGSRLASGVYFYKLIAGKYYLTKKLMLLK